MKAYELETDMWNKIFEEYQPIDLRCVELKVEPMFDEALEFICQQNKSSIRLWLRNRRYFFSISAISTIS